MTHGVKEEHWDEGSTSPKMKVCSNIEKKSVKSVREGKGMGSRRIFSPQFKLQVLDSYRRDADCRGNQRATARKYGIHRRQIQKWLQMESTLRNTAGEPELALNLASTRQPDDTCFAGSLPAPAPLPIDRLINVDKLSDSEDDMSSTSSAYEQEQALDFTCAALSKRRFFTNSFKIEVIEAFYNDPLVRGNQRATARKFGVHRRQVQKWLNQEALIRGEEPCLDLSRKRKATVETEEASSRKKLCPEAEARVLPSTGQDTALCLVKPSASPAAPELFRPYASCCPEPQVPDPWTSPFLPYYGCYLGYVSPWAQDASYYKHTVHSMHSMQLYTTPMYS